MKSREPITLTEAAANPGGGIKAVGNTPKGGAGAGAGFLDMDSVRGRHTYARATNQTQCDA